jgi:hypothetical protein
MASFKGTLGKCIGTITSMGGAGNRDVHILAASFAPAGTGAPTALLGADFTVTRTGTGQFTVQLMKRAKACLFQTASGSFGSTPSGDDFNITSDVSNLGQIVITYAPNGTVTDIAAGSRVNFLLVMAV